MIKNNKKGSVPVFLGTILLSFLLVVAILMESAVGIVGRGYADGVLNLAGRSILSEYDRHLKEDYGLFAVLMDAEEAEKKLTYYSNESFDSHFGYTDLFSLSLEEVRVDFSSYPLSNPDRLEKQIMEYMEFRIVSEGITALDLLENPKKLDCYCDKKTEAKSSALKVERDLKNQQIIKGLPSHVLKNEFDFTSALPQNFNMKKLLHITKDSISLNLYILKCFRHQLDDEDWNNTFFANEVEYILCGSESDSRNRTLVKASLLVLRTGIDLAHIYTDPLKRQSILTVAALVFPGAAAPAAAILIAIGWAAAEAANDLGRLAKGDRVPLYKTTADWMIDLDSLLEKKEEKTTMKRQTAGIVILKPESTGLDYENYLFLLLCFKSRETKLFRIMDLIQINMKGNYYSDFLLSHCYGGIDFVCRIERKNSFLPFGSLRKGVFYESHVY
ncbi:MAG: DUF5702 domain-containing protein [Eubacteriales bacterium]|nr:DUF5702 domain-containing protein [Eubacteriales bacterium]MDD3349297.1 DUF5702 domain-containing protein [Eubacteriales bacterium]